MTTYDPPAEAVTDVVTRALAEDLGSLGDLTSSALVPEDLDGVAHLVSRQSGVLAGTAAATEVFAQVDPGLEVRWSRADGEVVRAGERVGAVSGRLRSILTGERTALNLLSRLSGVATLTRRYVEAAGGRARIRDTRKTTPGLRALEKAAVRAGGGHSHREGLFDAVLVKDNHLAVVDIATAVARARSRWPGRLVEVECDEFAQVEQVAEAGADLVLLDNMTPGEVARAVAFLDGRIPVEVSGGVGLDNVAAYVQAGADYVAVGALTHSAPALDIGLDLEI